MINGADTVSLPENSPEDTVVGQLSCVDQDGGQSHTYELLNENNVFEVSTTDSENYDTIEKFRTVSLVIEKAVRCHFTTVVDLRLNTS